MPTIDVVIVGKLTTPEVSTGPVPPQPGVPAHPIVIPEPPLGIWGGGNVPYPTPPIYIPVPPPSGGGEHPENPIYIPVYPAHPIVIPLPPLPADPPHAEQPIYLPPVVWPPLPPKPPLSIWGGGNVPYPTPPIYLPVPQPPIEGGGEPVYPAHPIYMPVYPAHPIALPPDEGEKPEPPPAMVNPPTGAPGFWSYSPFYDSYVFVPYAGVPGVPQPPAGGRR